MRPAGLAHFFGMTFIWSIGFFRLGIFSRMAGQAPGERDPDGAQGWQTEPSPAPNIDRAHIQRSFGVADFTGAGRRLANHLGVMRILLEPVEVKAIEPFWQNPQVNGFAELR